MGHEYSIMRNRSIYLLLAIYSLLSFSAGAQHRGWNDEKLAGTGAPQLPLTAIPVFTDIPWDQALHMKLVPGSENHFLVAERHGKIWALDTDTETRTLLLQLGEETDKRRVNVYGVTFHPGFPRSPYIYLTTNDTNVDNPVNRILRYTTSPEHPLHIDPRSKLTILEWESNGHNGGDLAFGRDGYLYIPTGDGSSPGDPENVGQTTDRYLSSVLRIDVEEASEAQPYKVPSDNPFLDKQGVCPEVWAYGLRNPWRMTFHPETDELWVGDNGDEHWEMVQRIQRGANYGWSAFEGSHIFRSSNKLKGPTLIHTPPVVEHSHDEMRSVIGGIWYRGTQFPELQGRYVYGCYFTQKLWCFDMNGDQATSPIRLADTDAQIVGFTEGAQHELYIVTMDKGIFRLERAPEETPAKPIPNLLSETGLFASTATHTVVNELLPYDINVPMHWNGTRRERFLGMPATGFIEIQHRPPAMNTVDPEILRTTGGFDRWKMPVGTVLMQTFFLEEQRIETQVSYKERGEWRFFTYRWNEAQNDATLVPENGETAILKRSNAQTLDWRFPARVDCTACHTQRSMFVLGVNFGQLDKNNQLQQFQAEGFFKPQYRLPPLEKRDALPDLQDASLPLEDRARTYLHINCAHCHRETGLGGRANFQLLNWLHNAELGAIDIRPLVGLAGIDPLDARLIKPGNPEASEIYRRMVTDQSGRMPLLGGTKVDEPGAKLIYDWIESLEK
jgi:glucose/arabinose dehydrogenase